MTKKEALRLSGGDFSRFTAIVIEALESDAVAVPEAAQSDHRDSGSYVRATGPNSTVAPLPFAAVHSQ